MGMPEFSEWLVRTMKSKKISQAELARLSGLSPSQVSKIIRMESPAGKVAIVAIAHALDQDPANLFALASDFPQVTIEQSTLDELKNVLSQLPPERWGELIEHGWVMVKNARKVKDE